MKSFGTRLIVLILISFLALSDPLLRVQGYGTSTHQTISFFAYNAANNIQTNFFTALNILPTQPFVVGFESRTGQDWTEQGSVREDTDPFSPLPTFLPARPLFHFYDPQFIRGLSYTPPPAFEILSGVTSLSTSSSFDWATDASSSGNLAVCQLALACPPLAPLSASFTNSYSYSQARTHFYNGLTGLNGSDAATRNGELGLMFLSLGHTIHLLQDAAQPQHVRNDAHLEIGLPLLSYLNNPSVYEHYVDATFSNASQIAWTTWKNSYNPTSLSLPQSYFADGTGRGLAEYTNAGFVSAGTNCTTVAINNCNPVAGYNLPIIDSITTPLLYTLYGGQAQCVSTLSAGANGQALLQQFPNLCTTDTITFLGNNVLDDYALQTFQNDRMSTYSIFDLDLLTASKKPIFSLNRFNYDQQTNLLLPRAVGYSAGMLDYFFRGSMTAQGGPSGFTITNSTMNGTTAETMNGTFALYYDDQNGNRDSVQGASWSLSIAGGATSSQLTFTAPTNPTPQTPGKYIVVFQGTLGNEPQAVVGANATLQSANAILTVALLGGGSGRVTSLPGGINCSGRQTLCTASFPTGTLLTLTATPDSGSTFANAFCQGEPGLPPSSNPLTLNLTANVKCSFEFGTATTASILSLSCDQIAKNSVEFTAVTQATGSLSGPADFSARIGVGARPSPVFSNIYLFIGGSISSLDCGAWSPNLAQGTCTRSGSQPAQTTWSMTSTQQWDSNVPNPPPLDGLASVASGSAVLAFENIGACTIK